jgi:hypothetical protein
MGQEKPGSRGVVSASSPVSVATNRKSSSARRYTSTAWRCQSTIQYSCTPCRA